MDIQNELWKEINGFNKYFVSNFGNIKRITYKITDSIKRIQTKNEQLIHPSIDKDGYKQVVLTSDLNQRKTLRVHRIVGDAFIENLELLPFINHKDGIKDNNVVDNLEWCTSSENVQHAIKTGLCNTSISIVQLSLDGKYINVFNSTRLAQLETNIDASCISKVCKNQRKTAGGYKWIFESEWLKQNKIK